MQVTVKLAVVGDVENATIAGMKKELLVMKLLGRVSKSLIELLN